MRVLSEDRQRTNNLPNPKSSILKIKGSEIQQATTQLLLEIAGPLALPYQADVDDTEFGSNEPPVDLEWAAPAAPAYFNYRKTTIYGGSNEIQRNILAKAVLGF
jgi:alkylation response protein AidB-like acyl-CoA dehydrogenase